MAKAVPEDPYCGLADPAELARDFPALDMVDPAEPAPEILVRRAARGRGRRARGCRRLQFGRRASGLDARRDGDRRLQRLLRAHIAGTGHSIAVAVLAGEGAGMERDDDWDSAVFCRRFEAPGGYRPQGGRARGGAAQGAQGGDRQGAGGLRSAGRGRLLRHLSGAINGSAIARGTSFLKDKLGQRILPAGVTIIDDPHRQARPALQAVRRRGRAPTASASSSGTACCRPGCSIRPRRASWDSRPPATRSRGTVGTARPGPDQSLSRARRGDGPGADRRDRQRLLRHRTDGHGRQRHHRRLQPRRRRLLDRERRDRLSGAAR